MGASSRQPPLTQATEEHDSSPEPVPPRTAGGVRRRDRAPLAPVIGLSVTVALAATATLIAAVILLVEPAPIQGLESLAERQDAESLLYLAAFGAVLPITAVLVPRIAEAVARGPNADGLSALAAGLAVALAAVLVCVRITDAWSWGGGGGALLVGMLVWWSLAIAATARARGSSTWSALERGRAHSRPLWTAAAILTLALAASTADPSSASPVGLGVAAAVAVAAVAARRRLPALRSRWGLALDLGVIVLILLVVPDLVVFRPEDTVASKAVVYEGKIIRFHHDFLLGPANQVLHGHPMLIDTASQYGVGSIVFLAGWFKLLPISYGDFGLLDGILTALVFAVGYVVLRLVGVARALAAGALALGVCALVYNLVYPLGGLPQQGPLRFGLPILVVLAAVAGERWPRRARAAFIAQLLVVGLSAVWALEAFAYTLGTFAGLAAFRTFLLPSGRLRHLLRELVDVVAACAAAQLLFALATLLATSDLPQWGQYLAYLKEFLTGTLGDLTYDFSRNSEGLAVGAGYLVSAVALVVMIRRDRTLAVRERALLTAVTGTTAYGALLFTYFVNRSADHIVPYVSLPLLLAATLWLALVLRETPGVYPRRLALALSLAAAVGLFAIAWSSVGAGFERSAAAHAMPGGDSLTAAVDRLKAFPPTSVAAAGGQRALERWLPGQDTSLVIINPNAVTEVLIRAKRGNRLPLAHPWEDSFVQSERIPGLRREVATLRAGDRMLLDQGALAALRPGEGRDAARQARPGAAIAPIQLWTLAQIARRFTLKPIHRDQAGFVVVELTPRR